MYACMHLCVHIYVCVCVCAYMYVFAFACMCVCVCVKRNLFPVLPQIGGNNSQSTSAFHCSTVSMERSEVWISAYHWAVSHMPGIRVTAFTPAWYFCRELEVKKTIFKNISKCVELSYNVNLECFERGSLISIT